MAKIGRNMWLILGNKKTEITNLESFIQRYNEHNKSVKDFFRDSERLLCLKVGNPDDLYRLGNFLGIQHQNLSVWPHKNKGRYGIMNYL
ncbi:hypothetical protein [Moorena sp. SIO3E8]|uniref:hypothetical protein n=1 Tax=Moorena sp. SIO3E8 TaxID=2607830 RepID=UPI001418D77B|nr:hypothetical protein [Moorena sp. SIO3E8]NEO15304.1 hypothetical protein [Moorena sp. SIO3E8]